MRGKEGTGRNVISSSFMRHASCVMRHASVKMKMRMRMDVNPNPNPDPNPRCLPT